MSFSAGEWEGGAAAAEGEQKEVEKERVRERGKERDAHGGCLSGQTS